jgi:VanZ family protein
MHKSCRWPLIVAGLIAYGSLYPFHFALLPEKGGIWAALTADARLWTGLGDVGGNIALFVPLGATAVLCVGARRFGAVHGATIVLASAAFAFVIQALQVYLPSRQPGLSDVLWNGVGTVLGIGAGLAAERFVIAMPEPTWPRSRTVIALVASWVVAELWPFVPGLDWYAIKQSLRPLILAPSLSVASVTYHFVSVMVLGTALRSFASRRRDATRWLVLLVSAVVAGKLIINGSPLSLSFLTGVSLGVVAWTLLADRFSQDASGVLFFTLVAAFTLRQLEPFELRASPAPFHWLPFASMLEGEMDVNLRSLAALVFASMAMIWLVDRAGGRILGLTLALAFWVALTEIAQTWIVGRTADITPPLMVIATGFLFLRLKASEAQAAGLRGGPGEVRAQR